MSRKLRAPAATAAAGPPWTVPAVAPQPAQGDELVTHHESQTDCSVTAHRPDGPIVSPGLPGASHMHPFPGNGGLRCDPRGYDRYEPHRGAALGPDHRLPR